MPPQRNKLGRYIGNNDEGNIILPSAGTLIRLSLIFIVLYPWFNILSGVKLKMKNLYNFAMDSIPDYAEDDKSVAYSYIQNNGTHYTKKKKPKIFKHDE